MAPCSRLRVPETHCACDSSNGESGSSRDIVVAHDGDSDPDSISGPCNCFNAHHLMHSSCFVWYLAHRLFHSSRRSFSFSSSVMFICRCCCCCCCFSCVRLSCLLADFFASFARSCLAQYLACHVSWPFSSDLTSSDLTFVGGSFAFFCVSSCTSSVCVAVLLLLLPLLLPCFLLFYSFFSNSCFVGITDGRGRRTTGSSNFKGWRAAKDGRSQLQRLQPKPQAVLLCLAVFSGLFRQPLAVLLCLAVFWRLL